ncbi:hypothetical protein PVAP13_9KG128785 [Panicum virgatum]|uniref:Uncharacterized protein n=1 Tax=Panicum virgatum TaxID=38727 RepID=A0A8T0NFB8_PANVG|nr:hypothetical protein PVAP13_9KG128785 [Panicum virgatum]
MLLGAANDRPRCIDRAQSKRKRQRVHAQLFPFERLYCRSYFRSCNNPVVSVHACPGGEGGDRHGRMGAASSMC